jgi:hypothetical protein
VVRLFKRVIAAGILVAVVGTAADAGLNPLSIYAGAGYARRTNAGAPPGSMGFVAGATLNLVLVRIGAEVGYDILGSTAVGTTKNRLSLMPLSAQIYYGLPLTGSPVNPWLTIGAGPYTQRVVSEPQGASRTTSTSSRIGFNLGGGIDLALPAGIQKIGIDVRYHIVGKDTKIGMTESARMLTLMMRLYFV